MFMCKNQRERKKNDKKTRLIRTRFSHVCHTCPWEQLNRCWVWIPKLFKMFAKAGVKSVLCNEKKYWYANMWLILPSLFDFLALTITTMTRPDSNPISLTILKIQFFFLSDSTFFHHRIVPRMNKSYTKRSFISRFEYTSFYFQARNKIAN